MKSTKEALFNAVEHLVRDLARYRRMVEVAPEMHDGLTVEEFDDFLNEKCEAYHEKFSSKDVLEILIDGLADALATDVKHNGAEAASERFSSIFKKDGDR